MNYFFKRFPAKNIPPAVQSQLETTSFSFILRKDEALRHQLFYLCTAQKQRMIF